MHTILLRNRPRKTSKGNSITIGVVGDSAISDRVKQAIRELEHHPAPTPSRSLIDMLGIIEHFNFQIRFTEHYRTGDDLEAWSFLLQG